MIQTAAGSSPTVPAGAAGSASGLVTSKTSIATRVQEFERRLLETDSYLQILIDQVKALDQRIDQTTEEEERVRLVDIKSKTLVLLESVKHTIVLLQIAKVRE